MPIYMKIEGIDGDVRNQQYQGWFEVFSFSWGESNVGSPTGGGGGAGRVSFTDFNLMKPAGQGSTKLFLKCAQGAHIPAVQVDVTVGREAREVVLQSYKLSDVLISSFQTNGDGGSVPTESLSLNFTRIEFKQVFQGVDGRSHSETAFWNLENNSGGGGG